MTKEIAQLAQGSGRPFLHEHQWEAANHLARLIQSSKRSYWQIGRTWLWESKKDLVPFWVLPKCRQVWTCVIAVCLYRYEFIAVPDAQPYGFFTHTSRCVLSALRMDLSSHPPAAVVVRRWRVCWRF
jgi:hypothetical protein